MAKTTKAFVALQPLAQAYSSMAGRKRTAARQPNDDSWGSRQWLRWFLDNHSTEELIPLGVWMKPKFIVADYGDNDEAVSAMRAAYKLEGADGAVAILGAIMVGDLPEGTVLPQVPETWNDGMRYRYQEYRDPETRPQLWGVKKSDS